jgi:hypothetical protein
VNQIHEKLSVWAKLQKQWEVMDQRLRSKKTRPATSLGEDSCPYPIEAELRALRTRVDAAFNDASRALYSSSKIDCGGSGTDMNRSAPDGDGQAEHGR